jgi:hypothetical protein
MKIKSSLMGRWIKKLQGSFSPLFEVSTGQFYETLTSSFFPIRRLDLSLMGFPGCTGERFFKKYPLAQSQSREKLARRGRGSEGNSPAGTSR